jgi:pyrophosphatase PpaX
MIQSVLFDFDGTIINTNALIEEGLNYFAEKYRGSRLTKQEHATLTGRPLEDQMAYINATHAEGMTEQFRIWYKHHHNQKTFAFPGIKEIIKTLYRANYRLGIVSNNSTESIKMGLNHLDLEAYFEAIITRDDVTQTKPAPEGLHKMLDVLNINQEDTLFIGDTSNDILAAKNAGIHSVMVGWSHMTIDEIMTLEPDYIILLPEHLLNVIDVLNAENGLENKVAS